MWLHLKFLNNLKYKINMSQRKNKYIWMILKISVSKIIFISFLLFFWNDRFCEIILGSLYTEEMRSLTSGCRWHQSFPSICYFRAQSVSFPQRIKESCLRFWDSLKLVCSFCKHANSLSRYPCGDQTPKQFLLWCLWRKLNDVYLMCPIGFFTEIIGYIVATMERHMQTDFCK